MFGMTDVKWQNSHTAKVGMPVKTPVSQPTWKYKSAASDLASNADARPQSNGACLMPG